MEIKNIKEYNAHYHKDGTLVWDKIGEKVGKHIREKKTYPSISLDKIVVPDTVFNIEIDHVEDYNDFIWQMQHDDKFERMIQDMTIGRAMGGNPFDKYQHKWR